MHLPKNLNQMKKFKEQIAPIVKLMSVKLKQIILCIGVSTPPSPLKSSTTLFFPKPPSNLQTVQAPLFTQFPPHKLVFRNPLHPKNQIFE